MQLKYLGKDFLAVNRLDLLLHRQSFIGCPWVRRRPRFEHPPAFPVVSLSCLGNMGE